MSTDNRPTSPHLGIYRKQITSVLSIMHRMTGLALYAGTALMVWWLWVIAYDTASYATLQQCLQSPFGQFALMGWTASFFYHFSNGIRHLFWDAGMGFALPVMERTGWMVVAFTFVMTALTWNFILMGQ